VSDEVRAESADGAGAVAVRLRINERDHDLLLEPRTTLLETLRYEIALTGTKDACNHGNCGACTVLIDGRPQYACLRLAVDCADAAIVTIEGLATADRLHPVQQAFIDADALQCGFCTPGQVLSAVALLHADPDPDDAAIDRAMSGNLCRCGAYSHIREAVRRAARIVGG
jgi:xanthine dehydrogenase YagT iron-sulfur-binding subunit